MMRKKMLFMGFLLCAVMALLLTSLPLAVQASALQKLSLEDMTKKADVIAVGKIADKQAHWVGRHIETTFSLQATEYWKGNLGDSFEFTQMGGEVKRPLPIGMYADGLPRFFKGERVILFMEKPKKKPLVKGAPKPHPDSKVGASCQIVGWAQGKYTILKDPDTGEDKILRLGTENMQVLDKKEVEKRFSVAKMYSGAPQPKSQPMKMTATGQSTNLQKASDAKLLKNKISGQKPKTSSRELSQEAQSLLNFPKREKLGDFKAKIKSFLK